jgi:hypothetical protein
MKQYNIFKQGDESIDDAIEASDAPRLVGAGHVW